MDDFEIELEDSLSKEEQEKIRGEWYDDGSLERIAQDFKDRQALMDQMARDSRGAGREAYRLARLLRPSVPLLQVNFVPVV